MYAPLIIQLQSGRIDIHISVGLFVRDFLKEAVPTGSQFVSAMVLYRQSLLSKCTNRQSVYVCFDALPTAIVKHTSQHAVSLFCVCCCTDSCFVRLVL